MRKENWEEFILKMSRTEMGKKQLVQLMEIKILQLYQMSVRCNEQNQKRIFLSVSVAQGQVQSLGFIFEKIYIAVGFILMSSVSIKSF